MHWVGQLNVTTKFVSVAISWGFFCRWVFYWTQRRFDSSPLSTFLTRSHFVRGRRRSCKRLHTQKTCNICECTLQCGQAELKRLIGTRHASNMSSLTHRPAGGDASPLPVVHKLWQPVPQGCPAAIGCPVKRL